VHGGEQLQDWLCSIIVLYYCDVIESFYNIYFCYISVFCSSDQFFTLCTSGMDLCRLCCSLQCACRSSLLLGGPRLGPLPERAAVAPVLWDPSRWSAMRFGATSSGAIPLTTCVSRCSSWSQWGRVRWALWSGSVFLVNSCSIGVKVGVGVVLKDA